MEDKKSNRRVRMTKYLLKDALVRLMQDQHISKISVKMLCETADINRSTFYAHYSDPYDLLHQTQDELLANLKSYLDQQVINESKPLSTQVLVQILDYVKKNGELCKALLSENCEASFLKNIIYLSQIFAAQITHSSNRRLQEYLDTFAYMGCISILQKWLHDDTPESTEEMADLILQVLYHGIMSFH